MTIERLGFSQEEAATESSMQDRLITLNDTFLVARAADDQQQVVGFIVGPTFTKRYLTDELYEQAQPNQETDDYQTVLSLAVHPDYQGHGIAGELLTQFTALAAKAKRKAVTLTCLERLVPFYEAHGFVNEGRSESDHAGEHWYNLVKTLS
ncbi:GNAT family N-acetyltransferase [Furfurilactobacillus sp. WILCCON 0119]